MRVIVLAGTYGQFREWCRETGFPPHPFKYVDQNGTTWQAVWCDNPNGYNLRGARYDAYIRIGNWEKLHGDLLVEFNLQKLLHTTD